MTESVEIRLLGPFEVLSDGRPVTVTGSKRDALLTLLALARGRVVGVENLIDSVWGSELPASPRNAVQHHIARLRSALGHDSISATPEGYALVDADVDALRFEELLAETRAALRDGDSRRAARLAEHALALWRGPALQGLPDLLWVRTEASRLEALRIDALEEQFEAALALGGHAELVPALRRAVEESPYRERLWGQLMLALYRSGRQADALETFQEARRVLSEELGLDPGPALQRLQTAILAHDPAVAAVPVPPPRRASLPAPLTSFVGREVELARILELLRAQRMVTITGPPGVGKSRLALEAARSLAPDVSDGVWLVDLSRAGGSGDVARLVAGEVDVDGAGRLDLVTAQLRDGDALVVLDGCERFVEETSHIASTLLGSCPGVRVLATSREVLHLPGETRVALAPLELPADGADTSVAVDLFLDRARAARSGFDSATDGEALVGEICRRLDGLPLAIELAAARVSVLGLPEIRSALDRRFAWLRGNGRGPSEETAALRALVGWSYDLLHGDEKTLLHRLAVHRGGASLASLVAAGSDHGLDETMVTGLVSALVDKSVVTVSFPGGEARYDLLDTVRDYSLEHLAESGGLAAERTRHAEHFAALAESARVELRGPTWLATLKRLKLENDNLWAALEYAEDAADPATVTRLGGSLGLYFVLGERVSEGRRYIDLALESATDGTPPHLHVQLLAYLCYLATEESDREAALDAGERAAALAQTTGGPAETALAPLALSFALVRFGDAARAATLAAEALEAFEAGGDHWGAAAALLASAQSAVAAGDVESVAARAADVVKHTQAIGYEAFELPAALLQAWVAERREELDAAEASYRHALALSERVDFADHASFALAGLGAVAQERGRLAEAEGLYRRALAVAETAATTWVAAHARARLADVLAAGGDGEAAERLCRTVVEWSRDPRPHRARETLFLELAGDPAVTAATALVRPS
jgi:predicted ATPase/DNA-binding SARP family transcriptional activator